MGKQVDNKIKVSRYGRGEDGAFVLKTDKEGMEVRAYQGPVTYDCSKCGKKKTSGPKVEGNPSKFIGKVNICRDCIERFHPEAEEVTKKRSPLDYCGRVDGEELKDIYLFDKVP